MEGRGWGVARSRMSEEWRRTPREEEVERDSSEEWRGSCW